MSDISTEQARQRTVANERYKLLAAAVDRASTGCLVVGILGPLVDPTGGLTLGHAMAWFGTGVLLHILAQVAIGRLR